jgi:hypothetical protein
VGVSYSFLESVKSPLPHLESEWLFSLREFLALSDAHTLIDTPNLPKLQRLHDFNIMEAIQSSGKFTNTEVCQLNYCRLFLNVVTVSDSTDISGRRLDQSKREGHHSLFSS